ncbi:transcriptional regulator Stp2p [Diutina catenulata]
MNNSRSTPARPPWTVAVASCAVAFLHMVYTWLHRVLVTVVVHDEPAATALFPSKGKLDHVRKLPSKQQASLFPPSPRMALSPVSQPAVSETKSETKAETNTETNTETKAETHTLSKTFPTMTPTLCSTGLTTHILPFKNENGELEWTFADGGEELDAFRMSPSDGSVDGSPAKALSSSSSDNLAESPDDDKVHACPYCDTTFKIRGYLTRHLKKHATKKAYSCPFHKFSTYTDDNNVPHKCHPTGGFSRRDTYKTHLKSRHFTYPNGTKTKDRGQSPGSCGMCGERFANSEIWCEIHIEGAQCKHLPPGFKGKSRILKKLEKQAKQGLPQEAFEASLAQDNTTPSTNTPVAPGYDYHTSPGSVSSSIPQSNTPPVVLTSNPQFALAPNSAMMGFDPSPSSSATPFDAHAPVAPYDMGFLHPGGFQDDYGDDFCLDTDQLFYDSKVPLFTA